MLCFVVICMLSAIRRYPRRLVSVKVLDVMQVCLCFEFLHYTPTVGFKQFGLFNTPEEIEKTFLQQKKESDIFGKKHLCTKGSKAWEKIISSEYIIYFFVFFLS